MRYFTITTKERLTAEQQAEIVRQWKDQYNANILPMTVGGAQITYHRIKPPKPKRVRFPSPLITHCAR